MADRPQESIQRARQALKTASLVRERGDIRAALNRLYYACFHAARAMLYQHGFEPSTHSAVLSLFDRELVHEDDVETTYSKTLRTLFDQRQDADYGFGPVTGDVERLSGRTADFVDRIDELLDDELVSSTDNGDT